MAPHDSREGGLSLLVYLLGGSFLMMVLSGVFYALGLPESLARAFFIATVIIWIALGVIVIIQGQLEIRALASQGDQEGSGADIAKGEGSEDEAR